MAVLTVILGLVMSLAAGDEPTDAALRKVWGELDARARSSVVEYLELDLSHAETFQLALTRYVVQWNGIDPGLHAEAPAETWYDPVIHAPRQPIARRLLAEDAPQLVAARRALAAAFPERPSDPAFDYDWATRRVVRVGDPRSPTRRFEAALAGLPAEYDLVEAIVEAALDDGEQTAVLAAFARLYTDRNGNAYPGITLYHAWSSGAAIEMPDVDTLGIVHTIADDWKSWRAPVPASQHKRLYARIGEWFVPARHHRGLREALASTFLTAEPTYRDGYTAGNTVGFHALWNRNSSSPESLAKELPASKDWAAYLERLNAQLAADRELWSGGELRRDTLKRDQAFVRSRLVAIMRDLDVLPAAAPAAPDPKK